MSDYTPAPTVGIIGLGKLGTVLARGVRDAGYRVVAAGSGDAGELELIVQVLVPGIETASTEDAIEAADIVILAIPLRARQDLPSEKFAGKVVIDATNHWVEIDGPREDWVRDDESTSANLQDTIPDARVVKAFNHLGYHDVDERGRPRHSPERIAIALASDDGEAAQHVASLIDAVGFEPIYIGSLADSHLLEPGGPGFGAVLGARELTALLDTPAVAMTA